MAGGGGGEAGAGASAVEHALGTHLLVDDTQRVWEALRGAGTRGGGALRPLCRHSMFCASPPRL